MEESNRFSANPIPGSGSPSLSELDDAVSVSSLLPEFSSPSEEESAAVTLADLSKSPSPSSIRIDDDSSPPNYVPKSKGKNGKSKGKNKPDASKKKGDLNKKARKLVSYNAIADNLLKRGTLRNMLLQKGIKRLSFEVYMLLSSAMQAMMSNFGSKLSRLLVNKHVKTAQVQHVKAVFDAMSEGRERYETIKPGKKMLRLPNAKQFLKASFRIQRITDPAIIELRKVLDYILVKAAKEALDLNKKQTVTWQNVIKTLPQVYSEFFSDGSVKMAPKGRTREGYASSSAKSILRFGEYCVELSRGRSVGTKTYNYGYPSYASAFRASKLSEFYETYKAEEEFDEDGYPGSFEDAAKAHLPTSTETLDAYKRAKQNEKKYKAFIEKWTKPKSKFELLFTVSESELDFNVEKFMRKAKQYLKPLVEKEKAKRRLKQKRASKNDDDEDDDDDEDEDGKSKKSSSKKKSTSIEGKPKRKLSIYNWYAKIYSKKHKTGLDGIGRAWTKFKLAYLKAHPDVKKPADYTKKITALVNKYIKENSGSSYEQAVSVVFGI